MKISISIASALLVGGLLVQLPVVSCAHDISAQADLFEFSLEELLQVRVASLFQETNLSAPSTVSVYHEQEWIKRSARRADEIAGYQPGVVIHPTIAGANAFTVRGYSRLLSVRGIATLLDGVPLNSYSYGTAQYFLNNFDIGALERVELIRGPGSALYGSDAFHGVYSLHTYAPEEDQTDARLTLGTPEFAQGHVRTSQQLASGGRVHAMLAASGEGNSDIGFADANNPGVFGSRADQYESFTSVLKYQQPLSGRRDLELGFYYNQSDADGYIGPALSPAGAAGYFGPENLSGGDNYFVMVRANYEQPLAEGIDLSLKGYHWEAESYVDFRTQAVPFLQSRDSRSGLSAIVKHDRHHNEARDDDQWLLGMDLSRQRILSANNGNGRQLMSGLEQDIYSLYGHYRWFIHDDMLSLMLGGRYDHYASFDKHFSPRAAIVYQPQPDTAFKLLYGHAFRAPFGSELTDSGTILGDPNIDPEEIDTYELVYIRDFEQSQFQVSVFTSDYSNAIVTHPVSLPSYTLRYVNAGDYRSHGIELEYILSRQPWSLDTSLSYVISEDKIMNVDFVAFPEYILHLDIGYEPDGSRHSVFLSNQAYFEMQANTSSTSRDLSPYWITNLNYQYALDNDSDIRLDVRNLFDRDEHIPSLWSDPNGYPVDGINFAVTYAKRW